MEIQNYCIQCTDVRSGEVGDFFYEKTDKGLVATSPVFSRIGEFYAWARARGYGLGCDLTMVREES